MRGEATLQQPTSPSPSSMIRRLAPLAILLAAIVAFFALGLHRYLSFEALHEHREELLAMVDGHPFLAPLAFVVLYAVVIALSVPGGAVLTIAGGFLFGIVAGSLYVVVAATVGATIVFLIAKTALGDVLRAKAGPRIRRMEEGFREDAFNYLLVLRLIPIFPFWLVNIVPALLGVGVGTYVLGTFLGIIPGSVVFASVGNGLGAVFDAGETPDLGIIFKPAILGPIVGLALLALLPIVYRKYRGGKKQG
jgi:uncharacterized membrane protein YdjX (TVP38/TMEM64 family)